MSDRAPASGDLECPLIVRRRTGFPEPAPRHRSLETQQLCGFPQQDPGLQARLRRTAKNHDLTAGSHITICFEMLRRDRTPAPEQGERKTL
jgi:hypothetical protein